MKYTRREILIMGLEGAAALGFYGLVGDRLFAKSAAAAASSAGGNTLEKVVTNTSKSPSAKLHSIGVDKFDITSSFWKPKIEVNHDVSIPHQYDECERTGRIDNFRMASGEKACGHTGAVFNDSDVYKLAEATAYDLALRPDDKLQKQLDEFIRLVAKSQQSDGYLDTAFMGAEAQRSERGSRRAPGAGPREVRAGRAAARPKPARAMLRGPHALPGGPRLPDGTAGEPRGQRPQVQP